MKNLIYILVLSLSLAACSSPQEKLFNQIKELEQSDTIATPEGLAALAKLHKEYGLKYNDSMANHYLYAAAMYYFYGKNRPESKPLFLTYISREDSGDRVRNSLFSLATIYNENQQFDSFELMADAVIKAYIPTNQQWSNLGAMYSYKINNGTAAATDYERLSLSYTALGGYNEALNMLDSALIKFPDHPSRAKILYRAGFIAWDYLEDAERARIYYEPFLAEFPNDELAPQVKNILESGMLEMSNEDILEMLKAKNS